MMKFNKDILKEFRAEFNEAVKGLEEKYNATINIGNIKYSEYQFSTKLEVKLENNDAEEERQRSEEKNFQAFCKMYGFAPTDYEREFKIKNKTFQLIGFNLRSPKNCCKIIDVNTKEEYKCSNEIIPFCTE